LVEDEDVPYELNVGPDETLSDEMLDQRWVYIIKEMIFAFKYFAGEEQFASIEHSKEQHARAKNGLRLFGRYYDSLWT
jgi:hypothetical protein